MAHTYLAKPERQHGIKPLLGLRQSWSAKNYHGYESWSPSMAYMYMMKLLKEIYFKFMNYARKLWVYLEHPTSISKTLWSVTIIELK